tara:strand:+ start:1030 stop:1179 length:150 start_codon:yes stop_codon:yes gene_type:complete
VLLWLNQEITIIEEETEDLTVEMAIILNQMVPLLRSEDLPNKFMRNISL